MKRKLSQKETNFLKELEELLSRNEASVAVLNDRVSFFIDNKEEGDCVPTESYTDAASLSRLIKKGRVRLDWRQPEQYSAKAKALEAFWRGMRYETGNFRSTWTNRIISVDDREVSRLEFKRVTKVVYVLRVDTKYLKQVSGILRNMNIGMTFIEPVSDELIEINATDPRALLEIKRLIPSAEICKVCKPSSSPIF